MAYLWTTFFKTQLEEYADQVKGSGSGTRCRAFVRIGMNQGQRRASVPCLVWYQMSQGRLTLNIQYQTKCNKSE